MLKLFDGYGRGVGNDFLLEDNDSFASLVTQCAGIDASASYAAK